VISVAAVAVLSTLFVPTLTESRREAKETKCLFNLKRLGEAASSHASGDANEFALPRHPLMGQLRNALGIWEWGGKSGRGEPAQGRDPTTSMWGTQMGRGPATRGLNRIIYGAVLPDYDRDPGPSQSNWRHDMELSLDAFRCPADIGYAGHHYTAWRESRFTSYDHYGNSYAANAQWAAAPGTDCELMSNSPLLRPVSRVPNPGSTILVIENCGLFGWRANYAIDDCDSLSGGLGTDVNARILGWHGLAWVFATAYVDGHAGMTRIEGREYPQPRLARYPGCRQELSECYEGYKCIVTRGPGWQLDTLPAPLVPTGLPCSNSGAVVNAYYPSTLP
jgi:hypothetical protein